ncbi:MAG TPA: MOSC domain-containing protein [Burkholderiales bacterium]|nr:MOSC domain-containing protein [Burkholderiales bacterium]
MSNCMSGVLHSINVSDGGVPKLRRDASDVRFTGVTGDRQRDLRYHGGPLRAVSLYSLELIHALQAEGHPIHVGAIGENLTLAGIAWERMVPGARVEVREVLLELTAYAAPCTNLLGCFRDGEFKRVSQKAHPGWSRLYARVLCEGEIKVGDVVRVK